MRVNGRDVALTGSMVTQHGDERVQLSFRDLSFSLVFQEGEKADIVGSGEGKELTLTLTNFTNALGQGWFGEVGNLDNKPLFLALYIFSLGEAGKRMRLINYTLSIGEGR